MSNNRVLSIYQRLRNKPFGRKLFSSIVARTAPYFASIKPYIHILEPHHCEVIIKKRKSVTNHIGTVHVIAIANGLEMAMGTMAEASIPAQLRWLPKGMTLDYTAKAATDIRCVAQVKPEDWRVGNMLVPVFAYDDDNTVVVSGTITLWITEKPVKSS